MSRRDASGRRPFLRAGLASALAAAASLTACGGGGPDDDATLRAVNATSDLADIDVLYGDWRFAHSLTNGGATSGYAQRSLWSVFPRNRFEVRRAGSSSELMHDTKSLPDGETASVVVMGNLAAGLRLRLIDEDAARPGGGATRIRVLHAWPLVGAVDVFVTLPEQSLSGRTPDWSLNAYEDLSAFADVSGSGRLRVTPRGRTDLVLFDAATIGLGADRVATLVLAPAARTARAVVTVLPQGQAAWGLTNQAPAAL